MHPPGLILTSIVLSGASIAGCTEQPSPAEPADAQSVRRAQSPEASAAEVTREGFQGIVIADPDRGYVLTIGVPLSEARECGGTGEVIGGWGHTVRTPSGVVREVGHVRQQAMTLYGVFTEDICNLPEDAIVARGRGNAVFRTGTVELTSGGQAHLTVKGHFHIEPDGSLRVHVDRFRLQPIGG